MSHAVQFAVLGLGLGALYGSSAIGLVAIYRGSGVINFAHGAIGMAAAYLFYELRQVHHESSLVAFLVTLPAAALFGAAVHLFVMRLLSTRSPLVKLVATLAIFAILQGVALYRYPNPLLVKNVLPSSSTKLFGTPVGTAQLWILAGTVIVTIALWAGYRYLRLGRETAAVVEHPVAAAGFGVSPDRVAITNWMVGAVLAGSSGVLLSTLTGLDSGTSSLIVVPALAAAVVGRFTSFPIALIAGVILGILQAEATWYINDQGWASSTPFLVMIVFLLFRGGRIGARGEAAWVLPRVGSGRIRLGPFVAFFAVLLVLLAMGTFSAQWANVLGAQAAIAITLLSLTVILGYAGQLSLGQMAFAGAGALVAAHLFASGVPFIFALMIGAVATVPLGLIVGYAGTRTRGINLSILTLGLGVAMQSIVFSRGSWVGGASGILIPDPSFAEISLSTILHPARYAMFCIVVLIVLLLAVANLRKGRVGRRLIAVRSNERAAASVGIPIVSTKMFAFVWSGILAAIGGVLLSFQLTFVQFSGYGALPSLQLTQESVLGGAGSLSGPAIGATFDPSGIGSEIFNYFGEDFNRYSFIIGGVALLLTLLFAPEGLAAMYESRVQAVEKWLHLDRFRRKEVDVRKPALPNHTVAPEVLSVRKMTVRFGGVTAVCDVDLVVRPGQIVGVIGPNGAGKTTLLDSITGFVRASAGSIHLNDRDITAWSREKRAQNGLVRSFQSLELFDDLSVRENLLAACEKRDLAAFATTVVRPGRQVLSDATWAAIDFFQLADQLDRFPRDLAYGRRRLVAIARALAAEPSVLLLDEPAAGLDEVETAELARLVRRLANEWEMAIVIVEHDVPLVTSICDDIVVLEAGRCIASGRAQEVVHDEKVVRAYLGRAHEEVA